MQNPSMLDLRASRSSLVNDGDARRKAVENGLLKARRFQEQICRSALLGNIAYRSYANLLPSIISNAGVDLHQNL